MNLNQVKVVVKEIVDERMKDVELLIEEKVKSKTSLSIKYWYPTILTAIAFSGGLVYWYLMQVNIIEQRIAKVEIGNTIVPTNTNVVKEFKYFYNIQTGNDGKLKKNQKIDLKDIAFTLNNQRKDLVIIITGYSKDHKNLTKEAQIINSTKACNNLSSLLLSEGVDKSRIFIQGRGPDVPTYFPGKKGTYNCCVMLCDIYSLLTEYSRG